MVRREIGGFRVVSRGGVSQLARTIGLCAAVIAGATCGSTSRTSTGPTPLKCQPSVALSTQSIGASGGNATLSVTTQQECTWSVTSEAAWISGLTPSSGQGSAQVQFAVATNPEASVRQGALVVNDQRVQLRQEAAACRYEIAPKSHALDAGGDEWQVQVTAVTGCTWQATSNVPWVTVKAGASGTRDGVVVLEADPNGGEEPRVGSLTIAGESFGVAQAGTAAAPPSPPPPSTPSPAPQPPAPQPGACSYSLSPATLAASAAGGSGSASVQATHSACVWTVSTDAAWLTPSTSVGVGTQAVAFQVAPNAGAARTGRLTMAGQVLTVNQAAVSGPGPACTYSINPTSLAAAATGATASTVTVTAAVGCGWTATTATSWITITAGASGSGPGPVVFNVATNTGGARNGSMTIAGQTFPVTQAAAPAPCTYSINPTSQSIGSGGGNGTIAVTAGAGCGWSATSAVGWIVVATGASGSGNGSTTITIAPNTGAARSGTVTIAGHTYTVNQAVAPPPCTYSINPTSQSVAAGGANNRVIDVDTSSSCSWTAVSNVAWITIDRGSSDQGDGRVEYDVASNPGPARQGTITVAGQTFTVNQAGQPCSYTISPNNQSFTAVGGAGSVSVSTQSGCTWTATSNASWIVVTQGGSGTGNGGVLYTVLPNPGGSRNGTITIAGRTFTVSQN